MTDETKGYALEIERVLRAPIAKVWSALSDRSRLPEWYGPSDAFRTEVMEWDWRVGGTFRVAMHAPDGQTHTCFGAFREISPGRLVSYTWSWEGQPPMDSLVTFELSEEGERTRLRLRHEGLPSEEARTQHEQGWTGMAERLVGLFG